MESSAQVPDLMWRAFPPDRFANRKSWLATVARSLGWKQRRVKALFYGEARVVTADEWRTLSELQERAQSRRELHDDLAARTAALRSRQGSGTAAGDCGGAAPAGGRGDGTVARGARKA
jgi:hypothetical protein